VEGLLTEGSSEFFLFIYTVVGADFQKQLGTIGEIFSYLEENGEVVGKLSFKHVSLFFLIAFSNLILVCRSGSTVKFFQAVQEYTGGLDLMAILGTNNPSSAQDFILFLFPPLGSTVEENPPEDELCCGLLEWQIAQQAAERLSGTILPPPPCSFLTANP